jgi:Mg2+ and Co2+ transporter CorA
MPRSKDFADVFCFALLTAHHVELPSNRIHQEQLQRRATRKRPSASSYLAVIEDVIDQSKQLLTRAVDHLSELSMRIVQLIGLL